MNERINRQQYLKAVLHYFYQDNTQSGAHCKHNLKYHLVWITKYRRSFLIGNLATRLGQIFHQIAEDYGFKIVAYEVMPDHVHLLVESPPKYSPAQIVQYFKGISSKLMRQEFLKDIERHIWKDNTLWARGYYVASVADNVTTELLREYIDNQKPAAVEARKNSESVYYQPKLL